MSTLEIAILIALGVTLLSANIVASIRVVGRLGRYSLAYLLLVWFVPVIGALFVLAKIRPTRPASMLPINADTIANGPTTIQADPWPGVGEATEAHAPYRK